MPRPENKPATVGEHTVAKGKKPTLGGEAKEVPEDDDGSRTERLTPFKEALEASEKLFKQGTGEI
jgi:hypothetical protein